MHHGSGQKFNRSSSECLFLPLSTEYLQLFFLLFTQSLAIPHLRRKETKRVSGNKMARVAGLSPRTSSLKWPRAFKKTSALAASPAKWKCKMKEESFFKKRKYARFKLLPAKTLRKGKTSTFPQKVTIQRVNGHFHSRVAFKASVGLNHHKAGTPGEEAGKLRALAGSW